MRPSRLALVDYSTAVVLQVEFWRKGGSLDDEAPQAGNRFPAAHVDDWLQPSTSQQQRAVDSAAAVLSGSGQMMTADMER